MNNPFKVDDSGPVDKFLLTGLSMCPNLGAEYQQPKLPEIYPGIDLKFYTL
jgi:hypothetical protein